jgi:hypothetical protein
MSGTKRKKTHIPSDFKRRKAKVGKRALQPANLTDTSFKAVSLQVQGQSISSASGSDVVSTRGRSISELTHQLHHPAGPVRISAIRGLLNVIQSSHFALLSTHLSTLLPAVSKCACVDEEDEVRSLGLSALKELIHNGEGDNALWKPFVPLVSAFVISALNSLDRSIRLDGSRAVKILSHLPLDFKAVTAILPAYVTLLQDHSRVAIKQQPDDKKRKKRGDDDRRLVVLESLVSIVEAINGAESEDGVQGSHQVDLAVLSGGRSVNALLITNTRRTNYVGVIENLKAFASLCNQESGEETEKNALSSTVLNDLFSKLRDTFLEVSQRGSPGEPRGLILALPEIEELNLLVCSIHLLWKSFVKRHKSLAVTHMVNLMLEAAPVRPKSLEHETFCESLNGNLCFSLVAMGAGLLKQSEWTDVVLDYLLPRLEAAKTTQASIIMNVFTGLLSLKDEDDQLCLEGSLREAISLCIADSYFPSRNLSSDIARSSGAFKAVSLAIDNIRDGAGQLNPLIRAQIIKFPEYLSAWGCDFIRKSDGVVEAMLQYTNQMDLSEEDSSVTVFLDGMRAGLSELLVAKKKELSLFEMYPNEIKRKLICLVVAIGSPTEQLLKGLGKACGGPEIDDDLADFVLDVMHAVRLSVPMPSYVGFIMASLGVPKLNNSTNDPVIRKRYDRAVARGYRALRRCGTAKILPMISDMLTSWLSLSQNESLTRFRVALLFISIFAQDVDVFKEAPELHRPLMESLVGFFELCNWEDNKSLLLLEFERPLLVSRTLNLPARL